MGHSSFQGQASPAPPGRGQSPCPPCPSPRCSGWSWLFIQDNRIKTAMLESCTNQGRQNTPCRVLLGVPLRHRAEGRGRGRSRVGAAVVTPPCGRMWGRGAARWGGGVSSTPLRWLPGIWSTFRLPEPVTPRDRGPRALLQPAPVASGWPQGQHRVPACGTRHSPSPQQRETRGPSMGELGSWGRGASPPLPSSPGHAAPPAPG